MMCQCWNYVIVTLTRKCIMYNVNWIEFYFSTMLTMFTISLPPLKLNAYLVMMFSPCSVLGSRSFCKVGQSFQPRTSRQYTGTIVSYSFNARRVSSTCSFWMCRSCVTSTLIPIRRAEPLYVCRIIWSKCVIVVDLFVSVVSFFLWDVWKFVCWLVC